MLLVVLKILSILFLIFTWIPLLKLDYWWIRIFDYPRFQKLVVQVALLLGWFIFAKQDEIFWLVAIALLMSIVYLAFLVLPYSKIGKKMIDRVSYNSPSGIHLIVANIYQYNKKHHRVMDLLKTKNPDLIFLVETNQSWIDSLQPLTSLYPHHILIPMENTYGLALYSKLPFVRQEIRYLIDEDVPSLEIDLKLRSGKIITIYAIHPTPPVPTENPTSTDRDAEILIVGKKSKKNPLPSLVIGDLNDVAWSQSTSLFLKISELADPRRGRGFFNTFHAGYPFFRWPLDHIFLSKHFGLSLIKVLPNIGSDHFPIELKACLTSLDTTDTESATQEEEKESKEKINKAI
jgi:endonuclease/exonuclease/phosphatase (EEP) superfamily protein YafD